MRQLIVYTHPNPKSFNHAIMESLVSELTANGEDVQVRNLYEIGFDPVLKGEDFVLIKSGSIAPDVAMEQGYIKWADIITFIYPVWWTGLPAMLKGYIDRVFSFGFAYTVDGGQAKGLLNGKKVFLISTTGGSSDMYNETGMLRSLNQTSDDGIFTFCSMEVIGHKYFFAVPYISDADRQKMLDEIKTIAQTIYVQK
ncbi:MAG: NAD(P)H-dependent oxidoreductase [Candidatus Magnetoovum sp. WYHC-5]|nr:NAD(P)H-dependent oxidoreductase [Candidatus Magnetoovum sp. WYHC-5]